MAADCLRHFWLAFARPKLFQPEVSEEPAIFNSIILQFQTAAEKISLFLQAIGTYRTEGAML
jgi:hypothetical protein